MSGYFLVLAPGNKWSPWSRGTKRSSLPSPARSIGRTALIRPLSAAIFCGIVAPGCAVRDRHFRVVVLEDIVHGAAEHVGAAGPDALAGGVDLVQGPGAVRVAVEFRPLAGEVQEAVGFAAPPPPWPSFSWADSPAKKKRRLRHRRQVAEGVGVLAVDRLGEVQAERLQFVLPLRLRGWWPCTGPSIVPA